MLCTAAADQQVGWLADAAAIAVRGPPSALLPCLACSVVMHADAVQWVLSLTPCLIPTHCSTCGALWTHTHLSPAHSLSQHPRPLCRRHELVS
jgi:hypothetical protein